MATYWLCVEYDFYDREMDMDTKIYATIIQTLQLCCYCSRSTVAEYTVQQFTTVGRIRKLSDHRFIADSYSAQNPFQISKYEEVRICWILSGCAQGFTT